MALTNDAGGTIDGDLIDALVINLGANTLTNAGLIENTDTGGTTIDGAVANTGTLSATKGTLTVDGSVTGAGTVRVSGGVVDLAGAFSGDVTFTSTAGSVLELAHSRTDTVTVTGFATTNVTSLDLQDIAFTGATVKYSGTTTSGVLTVTSGSEVAKITLEGNYTTSTFTLTKDAGGGTIVTDPANPSKPVTIQPLITAMAGFGAGDGPAHAITTLATDARAAILAHPGATSA
jgi:hypothetical protein